MCNTLILFHNSFLSGERPFKCHICSRAFKQSSDLKKHINLHTGANQFKCEECNMEFRRADALRKHKLSHQTEGTFACDYCGHEFEHIGALRQHQTVHTGRLAIHVFEHSNGKFLSVSELTLEGGAGAHFNLALIHVASALNYLKTALDGERL